MMRKSAWLVVLLLLPACSVPFLSQPAAPTQALEPTLDVQVSNLPEPAAAVTLQPADPAENIACADMLEQCQDSIEQISPHLTRVMGTLRAYEAAASDAMSEVTATFDVEATFTSTPDMSAGMPTMTPTIDSQTGGLPTATSDAVPAEAEEGVRYSADAVTYKKNFAHPDKGCNWLGVAGQVLDKSGNPVKNLVVVAEGVLQGEEILQVDITGVHGAYGIGGYEIELGNAVVSTTNMIFVSVYDLDGSTLSAPVPITTRADCNQNLLILNFREAQ
jgi:hypothetical protein